MVTQGAGRHNLLFQVVFLIPNAPAGYKVGCQKKLKPFTKGIVFFFVFFFYKFNYEGI